MSSKSSIVLQERNKKLLPSAEKSFSTNFPTAVSVRSSLTRLHFSPHCECFLAIFDMQNTTQMMYNIFIQHVCSWKANSSQWILAKLRFFHTNYTFFTWSEIYFCKKTFNKWLQINQAQCSFDPSTAGY